MGTQVQLEVSISLSFWLENSWKLGKFTDVFCTLAPYYLPALLPALSIDSPSAPHTAVAGTYSQCGPFGDVSALIATVRKVMSGFAHSSSPSGGLHKHVCNDRSRVLCLKWVSSTVKFKYKWTFNLLCCHGRAVIWADCAFSTKIYRPKAEQLKVSGYRLYMTVPSL